MQSDEERVDKLTGAGSVEGVLRGAQGKMKKGYDYPLSEANIPFRRGC
jgi:hypothetical protein